MAKKHLAKRGIAALVIAVALTMGTAVGTAFAYYTDTTQAKGMVSFSYNPNPPTTEVEEYEVEGQKTVAIKNTGDVDAMVRVKVFYPEFPEDWGVDISIATEGDADEWTQDVSGVNAAGDPVDNDEGWLYWPHPVAPDKSTPAFTVNVTLKDGSTFNQPFDITVVQQCTSAKSFTEGQPLLGTFADGEKSLMQIMPAKDGE